MNKVLSRITELGLDKWINNIVENPADQDEWYKKLIHISCENENWFFDIDLREDPDFDDGYLGIGNLCNKNEFFQEKYYITDLWENSVILDNILLLLNCTCLDEFFNKRYTFLEEFENRLKKDFTVKVPIPLRKSDIWKSNSFNNYRLELYKDGKEVCVAIPLTSIKDYKLYFYKFYNQMSEKSKDILINVPPTYDANYRNFYVLFGETFKSIYFDNVDVNLILEIQKCYQNIDKNIFIKIAKDLNYQIILDEIKKQN